MGWLLDFLRAPSRLRELQERYEGVLEDRRFLKAEVCRLKGLIAQAKAQKKPNDYTLERMAMISKQYTEILRLRKLNGETNQKYVRAQDDLDQCRKGLSRRSW